MKEKITYAEAIRKVDINTRSRPVSEIPGPDQNLTQKSCKTTNDTLIVEKKKFVMFIVEVINCSAQTKSRTERIKIITKAAEKYLGIEELSVESINATLNAGITETQSTCGGGL